MYSDVELTITQALKNEFANDPYLKPELITSALSKETLKKAPPPQLPAIRVLFTDAQPKEAQDVGSEFYVTEINYTILFYFRNFTNEPDVYSYVQRIVSVIKNLQTPRGRIKPGRIYLFAEESYYAYAIEALLETVV